MTIAARISVTVCFVAGCSSEATSTNNQDLVGKPKCIDVTTFGATPDSTTVDDDTAAINVAIEAAVGGTLACTTNADCPSYQTCTTGSPSPKCVGPLAVCFPQGTYDVWMPGGIASERVNFELNGSRYAGLSLIGAGPHSSVRMYDPAGGSSCGTECVGCKPAWYMFRVQNGASQVQFKDLTLTSNGLAQFDEQTFPLIIGRQGQTADVTNIGLDRVRITGSCEDDVYITGTPGATPTHGQTTGVHIRRSQIANAGRRGITLKYAISNSEITDNLFEFDNTAAINFNSTACCTIPMGSTNCTTPVANCEPTNILVSRNTFLNAPTATVSHIEVTGTASASPPVSVDSVTISDNLLAGGGILADTISNLTVQGNVIIGSPIAATSDHEIVITNKVEATSVVGNVIVRTSTAAGVAIIVIKIAGSIQPNLASIRSNLVVTTAAASAIMQSSVANQEISDNVIVQQLSGTPTVSAIWSEANSINQPANVTSARIENNVVIGSSLLNGVFVQAGHGASYGNLIARGNLVSGATNGVQFHRDPTSSFLQYPVISRNTFDGVTTEVDFGGSTGLSPLSNAYVISGNRGGPLQFVGDTTGGGAPTLTAANGSIFLRRDSAVGHRLYIRENSTWTSR